MIGSARLALRLLRLGGRSAALSAGLVALGVTVATVLLSLALGGLHGWDAREQRTGWRADLVQDIGGREGGTSGVAVAAGRTEYAAGQPITVIEIAPTGAGSPPPPGLEVFPAAGQLFVSPALADLLAALPADELADRFPAPPAGTISDAGLRGPGELYAVVGLAVPPPDGVGIASYAGPADGALFGFIEVYRQLTWVAVILMAFPVVSLLGASARLSAARRTQRLALLRLLGASTRQVTVVGVTEITAVAIAAATAGVSAYWLLAPAVARIELGGGAWFADDVRPAPLVLVGVVVAAALLATGAAVVGLRRVVVGPLGVVRRSNPTGARLLRLLGLAAGVAVFAVAQSATQTAGGNVTGIVFGIGILGMFGAVYVIGPLFLRWQGRAMTRSARKPALLLAGRRLLDDPKGAFRPIAGLTLAVFVAGFLAPLLGVVSGGSGADDRNLLVPGAAAQAQQVSDRLAERGLAAAVLVHDTDGLTVNPSDDATRDRVRTALAPIVPGEAIVTGAERQASGEVLVGDLVRGALVVLAATFVLAATATGTAAAARVLDHRRTLRLLRLAGTPLEVLDAARRAETVRPLLLLGGIALLLGLASASPFAAASAVFAPAGLLVLGGVVVLGVLLVAGASAASRPLLRAVTTATERED